MSITSCVFKELKLQRKRYAIFFEAVHFQRPLISLGGDPIYNFLHIVCKLFNLIWGFGGNSEGAVGLGVFFMSNQFGIMAKIGLGVGL